MIQLLKIIFFYYWHICRLKTSPEHTPHSWLIMLLGLVLLALVLTVQWHFSELSFSTHLSLCFLVGMNLIIAFIIYTYAILLMRRLDKRFVQTITCLLFAYSIIHVLALPLFIFDDYLVDVNLRNPVFLFIGVIYLFITIGMSIWQFVVTAHIYKYALDASPIQSVLAAFGLVAVTILTLSFWR